MVKFLSDRQRKLSVGIQSYTESSTVLDAIGDISVTGIVTATGGFNLGISSSGSLITSGPITTLNFVGAANTFSIDGTTANITISSGGSTTPAKNSTNFVATAGQTTFSVSYEVGYVEVYLNGIRLSSSEYTATNGTSVVLSEGASEGDILDVIEFIMGTGATGATGSPGPLSGVGSTSSSVIHYPILVKETGNQDAFITTTSDYFSFIPSLGTLSVNQLNAGIVTATSFFGDGSSLTGIDATALKDSGGSTIVQANSSGVVVTGIVTATDFNSTSDFNLKTNIKVIDDPILKILQINGVSFEWKDTEQSSAGVIAQEVEEVMPEIIRNNSTGYKSLNYNGLIGLLIEGIKNQQEQINILKQEIENLKK